jgi:hypothetical protein
MIDGIATGALFAFFCSRTSAFASIATVGFDQPKEVIGAQPR